MAMDVFFPKLSFQFPRYGYKKQHEIIFHKLGFNSFYTFIEYLCERGNILCLTQFSLVVLILAKQEVFTNH